MQYDGLLYGPHKYRDLVRAVGRERVLAVYDDLPEMCEQAMSLDLTAILRSQPYNAGWPYPSHIGSGMLFHAGSVEQYRVMFDELNHQWRKQNAQ
jgi:hypothetical protein